MSQVNPYKIGDKKRKLDIGSKYADLILTQYNNVEDRIKKDYFIDFLVNSCPHHGYVIDYDIIKDFLSNVFQASSLSPEYNEKLDQISSFFINLEEDVRIIGFVESNDAKTDNGQKNNPQTKHQDAVYEPDSKEISPS